MKRLLHCCALVLLTVIVARAENWPQFRGPAGQGHSSETGLPLHWSDKDNVAWKTELPGQWQKRLRGSYSASPVGAEGRIYVISDEGETTVLEAGPQL